MNPTEISPTDTMNCWFKVHSVLRYQPISRSLLVSTPGPSSFTRRLDNRICYVHPFLRYQVGKRPADHTLTRHRTSTRGIDTRECLVQRENRPQKVRGRSLHLTVPTGFTSVESKSSSDRPSPAGRR